MKKINNPFIGHESFHCLCCSPANPIGLNLDFYYDEESQTVHSQWNAREEFQGYQNVLHGGIQATLLDEIASWLVYTVVQSAGVTSKLDIKYKKPVFITNSPLKMKARLKKHDRRLADIQTELYDKNDQLCAEALVQYFVYPEKIAKEKFGYPGIDAFLN